MSEEPTRDGAYVATPPHAPDATHATRARTADEVDFAHESELALAQALDFYGIVWEYEPHLFPIVFDGDGNPERYFRPDFYLPDFDLHLELTTAAAATTINAKNRKLRLIARHYPKVRVRLIRRDTLAHLGLRLGLPTGATPTGDFTARHPVISAP